MNQTNYPMKLIPSLTQESFIYLFLEVYLTFNSQNASLFTHDVV